MTKVVRLRRGTTLNHTSGSGFTGVEGEVTVDTTNDTLRVHDGMTKGGHELVGVAVTQRITNKDIIADVLTVSGVSTFVGFSTHQSNLFGTQASFSGVVTATTIKDGIGNIRAVPQNVQDSPSGYTLTATDAGAMVAISTGGITVPPNVFATGDIVSIYNNSGIAQTIYQGTNVIIRLAATSSTGTRYLSQYGLCSVVCVSAATTTFVISGAGLT